MLKKKKPIILFDEDSYNIIAANDKQEYYLICSNCGNFKKFYNDLYARTRATSTDKYDAIRNEIEGDDWIVDDIGDIEYDDDWCCDVCDSDKIESFDDSIGLLEFIYLHVNKQGKWHKPGFKPDSKNRNPEIGKLLMREKL